MMITFQDLLQDVLRWGTENTGNELSISSFYRAVDELKSYALRAESTTAELQERLSAAEAGLKHVHNDFAYCQDLNANLLVERDQLSTLVEAAKAQEPVGYGVEVYYQSRLDPADCGEGLELYSVEDFAKTDHLPTDENVFPVYALPPIVDKQVQVSGGGELTDPVYALQFKNGKPITHQGNKDYTAEPKQQAAIPDEINLTLITDILYDYASLQTSGELASANRYSASDAEFQARALDGMLSAPQQDSHHE